MLRDRTGYQNPALYNTVREENNVSFLEKLKLSVLDSGSSSQFEHDSVNDSAALTS